MRGKDWEFLSRLDEKLDKIMKDWPEWKKQACVAGIDGRAHNDTPRKPYIEEKTVGYHLKRIEKAEYGSADKIREEAEEFADAVQQGNRIMALQELSDIIGAIQGYLEKDHPGYCIGDLLVMQEATKRAFDSGHRV